MIANRDGIGKSLKVATLVIITDAGLQKVRRSVNLFVKFMLITPSLPSRAKRT